MAAIDIVTYMSPEAHEEFVRNVRGLKYPIEGQLFTGECSPEISEIKAYRIRIPESKVADTLRDIEAWDAVQVKGWGLDLQGAGFLRKAVWLFRKLTPWKSHPKSPGPSVPLTTAHKYVFMVGVTGDPKTERGNGLPPRETL